MYLIINEKEKINKGRNDLYICSGRIVYYYFYLIVVI